MTGFIWWSIFGLGTMITFQVESWRQYYSDPATAELWHEHYQELEPAHQGQMLMGPDVAAYETMDAAGMLVVVCAREAGRLVGYCLALVKRHLHYPTLCGFEDSYFLTRPSRRGTAGIRLIQAMRTELARRGCRRTYWMTKEFASVAAIFERLGMKKMDTVYVDANWES